MMSARLSWLDVAGRRLVEVRIDARAHQLRDTCTCSPPTLRTRSATMPVVQTTLNRIGPGIFGGDLRRLVVTVLAAGC